MLPKSESACFVIADISGYTGFLAGVELDHAQEIIAHHRRRDGHGGEVSASAIQARQIRG